MWWKDAAPRSWNYLMSINKVFGYPREIACTHIICASLLCFFSWEPKGNPLPSPKKASQVFPPHCQITEVIVLKNYKASAWNSIKVYPSFVEQKLNIPISYNRKTAASPASSNSSSLAVQIFLSSDKNKTVKS